MKIENIDHIGIYVRDLKKATKFFADLLGTEFTEIGEFKEADVRSAMDPSGIELFEPLTPDGPAAKAIERRGEGLALLSLKVPNLEEGIAAMESRGIRLTVRVEHPNSRMAIFHPKDTYGVMIELVEYEPEHPIVAVREE